MQTKQTIQTAVHQQNLLLIIIIIIQCWNCIHHYSL